MYSSDAAGGSVGRRADPSDFRLHFNGELVPSTDVSSTGGIAGIQYTGKGMFPAGVFLDDTVPGGAGPARLAYTDTTAAGVTLAPGLNQVFFLGDGWTGTGAGSVQQFTVPATATRLSLGFVDAPGVAGPLGIYGDNTGSFTATVQVAGLVTKGGGSLRLPPDAWRELARSDRDVHGSPEVRRYRQVESTASRVVHPESPREAGTAAVSSP